MEIEDELTELHATTGVLHLAHHDMSENGVGETALALSVFSAARTIKGLMERIKAKLAPDEMPCACGLDKQASP
jgi:hypothetical protein